MDQTVQRFNKLMKVAHYTDQVYKFGGIERVLTQKVNYLSGLDNMEIYLITREQKGKPSFFQINGQVWKCNLGIDYKRNKSYLHPINLIKIPKHILRFRKSLKMIDPDLLVVASYGIDFYFIPFLKKSVCLVKEFHSSRHYAHKERIHTKSWYKKLNFKINDYIESKYDKLIVLTPDEKRYYKSETIVIPNALSLGFGKISGKRAKRVISAGRLAPVKGFHKLIEAWSMIAKQNPDWELVIYGEGDRSYKDLLNEKIKYLGLENSVKLAGTTSSIEVKMSEASIYAMASVNECFPLVLLEAQACGLPIVSFNCPNGPRNIIEDGKNGYLVKDQASELLGEKINELINNNAKRLKFGEQARFDVQKFNEDKIMEIWVNQFKTWCNES